MRIYWIIRGANVQDQINEAIQGEPNLIRVIGESPLPQNGKIAITYPDIRFYTMEDGKDIPLSGEDKTTIFDVVSQVGNSKTGDIDVFAYAKADDEP